MGQRVWMQDQQTKKWDIGGVIKSVRNNGRSYVVETDSGAAYLRNRRYIKAAVARIKVVALRTETTMGMKKRPLRQEGPKKKVSFQLGVHFNKEKNTVHQI